MTQANDLDPKEYSKALGFLQKIDFLNGVPEESLKGMLFTLQKQKFGPKRTILFQGEIANRLFMIIEGSVVITTKNRGTKIELAELSPPMYFGEISLLRPTSATATVTSGDNGADVYILAHDAMNHLSKKIPDIETRIQQVIDQRIESKNKAKLADEDE